jgi:hypothetical protein
VAIQRLSDGLTPANGSDPRTFPTIWNNTATLVEAAQSDITVLQGSAVSLGSAISGLDSEVTVLQGSAVTLGSTISVAQSDIDNLEAKNIPTFGTAIPVAGQVLTYSTAISGYTPQTPTGGATIVNTDGDPGSTIYVGSIDPDVSYSPAVGDVWIQVP